ncbi:MAG: hypothetical protein LC800_05405 [Acidobacteria bacterium]|nr:hypothetical protein [Acidobacteriota bacterium]
MLASAGDASATSLVRFYRIGGRLLAFNFDDETTARLAGKFLECFYFRSVPAVATSGPACCTVEIFKGNPPRLPDNRQTFEVPRGSCHASGGYLHFDIDESRVTVHPAGEPLVSVWLGETEHARHPVAVVNALSYAIQAALRKSALFDFHAAGVVEPRTGAGLLIAGGSNSGKSSLTIRLASSGWGYLSDDMLVLEGDGPGVRARALRRIFAVSEGALAGLGMPDLFAALGAPVNSDRSKRRLEPGVGFPGRFVADCVPRVLCFARITGEDDSRVEPLSRAEAMRRLIRHCPWASYDHGTGRAHLGVLGRLAGQCSAFLLYGGRDLLDEPSRAAELLGPCFVN